MLAAQKWMICEKLHRWTPALRVAFSRLAIAQTAPRLHEARTLGELSTQSDEHGCDLVLVEADRHNLSEVLQLLAHRRLHAPRVVALLADIGPQRHAPASIAGEPTTQAVTNLLWEAGAVEIVESPRQICRLLALHNRLVVARASITVDSVEPQSFAEWAWSTLPWQDR
jgi:hypothetical protein